MVCALMELQWHIEMCALEGLVLSWGLTRVKAGINRHRRSLGKSSVSAQWTEGAEAMQKSGWV